MIARATVALLFLTCLFPVEGNSVLNVTGIRLQGGSGTYEGRVEVIVNGIWGTICHNSFDMRDARVLCRMMGLSATTFFTGAHFGQGNGPIFAERLDCVGYESHINRCSFVPNVHCTHTSDVGIICTGCGEIDITNGKVKSISANGTVLSISCNDGYVSNTKTSTCLSNGVWSMPKITCTSLGYPLDISDIRLANGLGFHDGRVEVLVNGVWGTICGNSFTYTEADVICKFLNFKGRYQYYYHYYAYGMGQGPIYLSNLDCSGTETHINNCTYTVNHSCSHYNDAAVVCRYDLNVTDIRLQNGTGQYDGRVEIKVNNTWGTICNRNFDKSGGAVLCKMLNLTYTHYFTTPIYGSSAGPIYIEQLFCSSSQKHINACSSYPADRYYCTHDMDLSLVCTECGEPNIINAVVSSFNGTVLTATCFSGYVPQTITLYCLENGTWIGDNTCKLPYEYPLNITDIRLIGGHGPYEGTIQVKVNEQWGYICNNNFDNSAAEVVCKMIGYQFLRIRTDYSSRTVPEYISQLQCNGTESHINECSYEIPYICSLGNNVYYAGVECTGYQLNISGIRLAGTSGPYHGRVEIEVNNTWGTICDNYVSSTEASVLCYMLGLEYYTYNDNAYYGEGTGPVYIDKLDCSSPYLHIDDCKYITEHTCQHRDDVSVQCYGPKLNITDARLASGTGPFDGRAEIKVNDTWGTICDNNFNINDADTFCNMLGLKGAQYFTGATHGQGTGPVYVDEFFCESYSTDLSNCKYLFRNSCKHDRDVSVVCNECGQPEIYYWDVGYFSYNGTTLYADCSYYRTYIGTLKMTCDNVTKSWVTDGECQEYKFPLDISDIRLKDGTKPSNGRVEIKVMDTWGTVCDNFFGKEEADTVCRMIGYAPAFEVYSGAYFGEGKGPIFVDDLNCLPTATHLNNCSYVTYDDCDHSNDVSVICTDCGDPTPANGQINSSESGYGAVVEVSCKDGYLLLGDAVITCQLNNNWTDSSSCKLIDCQNPAPPNGQSNTTDTVNGTVAKITCDTGYILSGSKIITCQANETWTDYPSCNIVDCGIPSPNNANVALSENKTTYEEIAVVSCNIGFRPDGSTPVSCLANGTWESWPSCNIIDCGDPTPNNGNRNSIDTTYGSVVSITCDHGLNITGNSTIICRADGTWSDNPVCDASDCGLLSVPNGKVNASSGTTIGSSAFVTCNKGYRLEGTPIAILVLDGWNSSVSCQKQDCGDPTPENGERVDNGGTEFGSSATIECNTGYESIGDNIITCDDGGLWSDNPLCKIKDCKQPENLPVNGKWDDSEGTKYNATIYFVCDDRFLLVGRTSITCKSDGKWSSSPPLCVEKSNIGGTCVRSDYCFTENAKCINQLCSCVSRIHDEKANKCDTMPLLPYGLKHKDKEVSKSSVCGEKILFSPGIPMLDRIHKELYVCSNGIISFDSKYTNPTPPRNRDGVSEFANRTLVAPFHAPINSSSGSVFYRIYDIQNNYKMMKEDRESQSSLITYLEEIVTTFGDIDKFDASFVLVATWDSMKASNNDYDKTQAVTFQAVLISDGSVTFSFFIYGHNLMQWRYKGAQNPTIWVGYAINQTKPYTHPFSFSDSSLGLDTVEQSLPSSFNGVTGLIFKPLSSVTNSKPNYDVECITWYNTNLEEKQKNDIIASRLPDCPCDIWLSRTDPWFWNINRWLQTPYTCVNMFPGQIYQPYGKSCCYDLSTWLWTDRRPVAGSFLRYHPDHQVDHYINDVHPRKVCCELSNYCNLFYDLRPTGACYRQSPYNFGIFWGDPHFQTLDGLNFTFNGLGEYTLLKVRTENISFDLQARTERARKQDGSLSDATVFSAFAAKDSSNASFHVEMNKAKNGLNLYGNKIDLTDQYNSHNDIETPFSYTTEEENIIISKRGETLTALFPFSGISLNISFSAEMLSLNTLVPKTLHNATNGLLGNYDGLSSNDFMMPNGTILSSNMSDREVFAYGKTWAINMNDSAFVYEEGTTHLDYHNDSYVPRFLDEVDDETRKNAEKVCNGSQNIECIFDFVFTEKTEIAQEANRIKGQADSTRAELDETVPSLAGCDTVNITKGDDVNCQVTLDDETDLHFIENNVNARIDPETSTVSFKQIDENPSVVRFYAKNAKDRSSPSFIVSIILCTGCHGNGYCTDEIREDTRETEYFKYATCVCKTGYEGSDCEREFDACSENPCSLGRNCTRIPLSNPLNNGKGYTCGKCPRGYHFLDADNDECLDIDECSHSVCEHTCTNTDGSYQCSCEAGFRVDYKNTSKCRDINECDEARHNCSHICNNTNGGFTCQCHPGYMFNTSSWRCDDSPDESKTCSKGEVATCNQTAGCIKDSKSDSSCFCESGFELDETGKLCKDIDECKRSVCPQNCSNTNGSFECKCFNGYKLQGKTTCKRCEVPHWGENCSKKCECTGQGADRCDPVKGCICLPGWTGKKCNNDIDECSGIVGDICKDSRKECVNNQGSYSCRCIKGFIESFDGTCEDFDECLNPVTNNCTQLCTNTVGGYTCGCHKGFSKINNTHCKDIDECTLGTARCEQFCENSPGHYSCYCYYGYTLKDDRKTCLQLKDPCKTLNGLNCSHYCHVKDGTSTCKCRTGYKLLQDKQTCTDINECSANTLNECSVDSTCNNTNGSYVCQCPIGTKLENDGRTCLVCDEFHFGVGCSKSCSCLHGHCDKTKGCICTAGWEGAKCDIDINECTRYTNVCKGDHIECINTPGSSVCRCQTGFQNVSGRCKDIDECRDSTLNTCDQKCINNNGSYSCACETGFVYRDEQCEDINECLQGDRCDQTCENTVGSYRCMCEQGFSLDLTDRKSCIVNNKCTNETNTCGDHATCFIKNGKPGCICSKGFEKHGSTCEDINECGHSNGMCTQICNNTLGSHICSCNVGFVLLDNGITCQECPAGMFGEGCKHKCSCITTNTNKCDNVNGTCSCHQGWRGKHCDEDIDECTSNSDICPENSKCENSVGSYSCKCNSGFIIDYKGLCKDINECESNPCTLDVCENIPGSYKCKCDTGFTEIENKCARCTNNKFGVNCSETCRCKGEHSANIIQTCDTATGKCMCQPHWQGDTCSDDVDECEDKSACKDKDNTVCINYDGGYSCKCEHGYKEYPGILCIKDSPIMIDLTVNLNVDVSDKTDPEELKRIATESLKEFYSQYTKADIEILIRNITFGSSAKIVRRSPRNELTIDYTVTYKEDDISVASELTVATMDLSKGAYLKFDGHTVVVNAVNLEGKEPCDIYEETVGRCVDGFKCEVENERPVCRKSTSEVNLALIIGVSCGCFILLLLIIIVIMCLRQRNQRKKEDFRMQRELTSASDMGMKLENINSRQGNIYNVLDWQTGKTAANIGDKGDDNESKYMTWKSIASRFTMASGNDSRNDGQYHIPRARMKASPSPNPDYVTPREY